MDTDQGKLFVGGISWETTEEKLKDYFQAFGEVVEAVIMKDRATGRARGFGFVVFADPSVADMVVLDKHSIDGRLVEAKKAVPREEQQSVNRNNGSGGGLSPSSVARTKKIFVGGLASSVTESDFRTYFEQFGAITDVVVMYDHNTQRPRGFGFITFDSEDAVDRVLLKTFHELNDKMVEVKRAIPKDLSPSPNRHMAVGLGASPHRGSPYYAQAFNSNPGSPYAFRMDNRFGSPLGSRGSYLPSYGALGYASSANYGGFTNGVYGTGTFGGGGLYNGAGYSGGSTASGYGRAGAGFGSSAASPQYGSPSGRNVWGNGLTGYGSVNNSPGMNGSSGGPSPSSYTGTGTWGASQASQALGNNSLFYGNPRYGYGGSDGAFLSSMSPSHTGQMSSYGNSGGAFSVSRTGSGAGSNSYFGDLYGSSGYGDSTWRATPADTLKAARTGSGGLGTGVYGLDSSNGSAEEVPNSNEVYNVSGTQPYKGNLEHNLTRV
ncbi:hypothetical protein GOP47_0005790 [Adiantum capillus-veneris]|uniref:RRM domain-containing protein n=1 Tax=Adiantum capillus-veneris TaxID=13818 RepID=A0A9D4V5Q5_ADICA|nr:hypothetical protein GOP47_0005790 [Adiantum capillus-veneris]